VLPLILFGPRPHGGGGFGLYPRLELRIAFFVVIAVVALVVRYRKR
jgi:hypothetical protein